MKRISIKDNKLQKYRVWRSLTREQLSKLTEVSVSSLSNMERQETSTSTLPRMLKIAEALDIRVGNIFPGVLE